MWLTTSTAGRGNLDCGAGKITGQPRMSGEFGDFCGKNKIALILDAALCMASGRGPSRGVLKVRLRAGTPKVEHARVSTRVNIQKLSLKSKAEGGINDEV
jgi:hypothetical protein